MALKRDVTYPGRYDPATPAQPQGAFKNRTAPEALDGSYLEEGWLNDWSGFFSRLIAKAGLTLNGNVDTAEVSQYMDAAEGIFKSGRRNLVINGDFRVNQRGTTWSLPNSQYTSDQWRPFVFLDGGNLDGTGFFEIDILDFPFGELAIPDGPEQYFQMNGHVNGGISPALGMGQRIEGVENLSNGRAVASFWIKGSAAGTSAFSLTQHFGTGGFPDAEVDVFSTEVAVTTDWVRHSFVFDVPAVDTKTKGTNNNDHLAFTIWDQAGPTQSGFFDFGNIDFVGDLQVFGCQLEAGDAVTDFQKLHLEEQLLLCYRYYQRHTLSLFRPTLFRGQASTANYSGPQPLLTPMRGFAPTGSIDPIQWQGVSLNNTHVDPSIGWLSTSESVGLLGDNEWYFNHGGAANGRIYAAWPVAQANAYFTAEIQV